MDLFKVNRYRFIGDEAGVSAGESQLILERLHQKAEERKRQRHPPGKKNRKHGGNKGSKTRETVQSLPKDISGEISLTAKDRSQRTDDGNNKLSEANSPKRGPREVSNSEGVGGESTVGKDGRRKKKRKSGGLAERDVIGSHQEYTGETTGGVIGETREGAVGSRRSKRKLNESTEESHSPERMRPDGQKKGVTGTENDSSGRGQGNDPENRMEVGGEVAQEEVSAIISSKKRKKRSKRTGDASSTDIDGTARILDDDSGDVRSGMDGHQEGSPEPSSKRNAKKRRSQKDDAVDEDGAENDEQRGVRPSEGIEDGEMKEGEMFPVLGDFTHAQKEKVNRVLPEWLAKPTKISSDIKHHSVSCSLLPGLDKRILSTLGDMKITAFFPVQTKVIPLVLQSAVHGVFMGPAGYRPGDLCVAAPTGSGKTLAFAIPIVQILMDRVTRHLRALVVLPTKDLAAQVFKVFLQLTNGTPLNVVMIGGQRTLKDEGSLLVRQSVAGEYQCACDIVVATPGRLVDHVNHTRGFTLRHLRFLVIDEADNLMVQHSKDWISRVEREIGESRAHSREITVESEAKMEIPFQKLLFSATLSHNPEHLIHFKLFQPRLVTSVESHDLQSTDGKADAGISSPAAKYVTPASLEEYYMVCDISEKPLLIVHLLKNLGCTQVLCFTNSVEASHRLYLLMTKMAGIKVGEFSSKLSGAQRQNVIKQFKNETMQLLICSDVMARGMDLSNVKYVVSYDAPLHLKTYIHRVGRTARAGRRGTAYTILLENEVSKFERIVGKSSAAGIKQVTVEEKDFDKYKEDYQKSLRRLPLALKDEIYQQKNR